MGEYAKLDSGPITGLATPLGSSAIGVIRCSGAGSIELLAPSTTRMDKVLAAPGYTMVHTGITDAQGSIIDDVILGVYRSPRSYTGEDSIEIMCHGSVPGIEAIFSRLFELGFRQAKAGEFTLRAFLNGKVDLTQAEAVQELVSSRSREAHGHALNRLSGALFQRIDGFKKDLVFCIAGITVQLDYAEDEVDAPPPDLDRIRSLRLSVGELAGTWELGRRYKEGVRLALAGKTNAGKSSLFNALVREDRAIVSSHHGTTRDYLEASMVLGGIPVRLFDTAGLRETIEEVEQEGIRRSSTVMGAAAVLVYVVDGGLGFDDVDRNNILPFLGENRSCLIAWNKVDTLESSQDVPGIITIQDTPIPVIPISARAGHGMAKLHEDLLGMVRGSQTSEDAGVLVDSERQYTLLQRCIKALDAAIHASEDHWALDAVAMELGDALAALGEITGEVSADDILDVVFSGFCVGK